MNCVRLTLCLFSGLLFLLSTLGHADLAPISLKDGRVLPLALHESIRMDLQDVRIQLRKTDYTVDAVFRLFNTGETITQSVGVPMHLAAGTFVFSFRKFNAWIDGQHVAFSKAKDLAGYSTPYAGLPFYDFPRWMVGKVIFPGHSATTIRIRYEAPVSPATYDGYYIYGNSWYWKDKIEKLVFTVDATEIGGIAQAKIVCHDRADVRTLTKNLLRYEITNVASASQGLLDFRYKLNTILGHTQSGSR